QRSGRAPPLGRLGLDDWGRALAPVSFELVAVAAQSEISAQRACDAFHQWLGHRPRAYFGAEPWREILRDMPEVDVVAVATPDPLHTPVILAALAHGSH